MFHYVLYCFIIKLVSLNLHGWLHLNKDKHFGAGLRGAYKMNLRIVKIVLSDDKYWMLIFHGLTWIIVDVYQ